MRPLEVILHAFGPYKDKIHVDFNQLNEKGLFAITGPTGAGKTTIFDGICFALYGEASGENRNDQTLLRSHFADDEVYTSVDLTFELKGKHYNIFRQKGHQKKQNKGITGDKIEFYKIENSEKVPYCQEFNKTTIVNKKVEELLGINADQFKQIVLLPQGEFRKLLVSDTKEKEEILRKIFKTELFDKVKDTIGIARSKMESNFRNLKQKIVIKLETIEDLLLDKGINITEDAQINIHIVNEILGEHISTIDEEIKQLEEKEKIQKAQKEVLQQKLYAAETHNKNIYRLQELNELITLLNDQQEGIKQKKSKLSMATRAEKVLPQKNELAKLNDLIVQAKEKLQKEHHSLTEILQLIETISLKVDTLPEKNKELSNFEHRYSQLLELKDSIVNYQKLEEIYVMKTKQLKQLELDGQKLRDQITKENEELYQLKNEFIKFEGIYEQWNQITLLKQQVHQKGGFAKRIVFAKNDLDGKLKDYDVNDAILKEHVNKLNSLEMNMLQQRAAYLAKDLKDQEECPVCGSTHHPSIAKFAGDVNEHEVEVLKAKVTTLQNQLATKHGEIKNLENTIQLDQQSFIEEYGFFEFSNEGLRLLANEFKEIDANLSSISERKESFEKIQKALKEKEQFIESLTIKATELGNVVSECSTKINELKVEKVQIETMLPETTRTYEAWNQDVQKYEKNIQVLQSEILEIEGSYKRLSEQKTIKETTCSHLEHEINRLTSEIKISQNSYKEKLSEYQFSHEEEFLIAIELIQFIDEYQNDISKYEENSQRLITERDILEKQVQSKEKIDENELRQSLQVIAQQADHILNDIIRIQELSKRLSQLRIDLQTYQEEYVKTEKKLAGLNDLYKVTKGDNEKMISFERYVLLDYFEQIIESANVRLDHLSNGQFQLQRKDSVEKGRKQSGLGLEVYDSYTGLARDVKTLSGGEQFNASLCLALGMADIIQAHKGGVSIDTLFIDEGFGSLDDELLAKAIDTLIQLQKSGRLIGVISHVQDVKDAMPAVIEVHKTNHGYSEISIVVK
ncbi:AAA family ATPase [Gottfriedia solisilvae]|uniref:Nuclease SbcCD subunit C n=1 Tax=Gottfriedia solisilvae TaxID=1516104 RepID=A0A8J3AKA6_9BACI|nr:AAA family ATPase [Gottfriedia solisilvae]GGI12527.1 nuclease SbcCD subunit C [Gottfriedia solisilvae]